MSSFTVTPPDNYTAEEKDWLKRHYGGEFRFLRSNVLNITKEEQREEARAIARALIEMDEEDELKSAQNNANYRSRERSSSRPASHSINAHQPSDGHGYYDKRAHIGSRETPAPGIHGRYEFSDHHHQLRIPGKVDANFSDTGGDQNSDDEDAGNHDDGDYDDDDRGGGGDYDYFYDY